MASNRATYAAVSIPEGLVGGAGLAVLGCRVLEGQVGRASTSIGLVVPDMRSSAGDALSGIGVEVRVLAVALALGEGGIEGESGRAALAFLGVVVPMGISGAALALLNSGVPEVRFVASNTDVSGGQVGSVSGAVAAPGVSVKGESSGAGEAGLGVGVPDSWSVAGDAAVVGIEVRSVGGAVALEGVGIKGESGGASGAGQS